MRKFAYVVSDERARPTWNINYLIQVIYLEDLAFHRPGGPVGANKEEKSEKGATKVVQ